MAKDINRAKLHEIAIQLMYSFLMLEETNNPINFENAISEACDTPYEECDIYLKETLLNSLKYQNKIITYVSKYLKNREFHRLNLVIQAIFIVSITEYYFVEEKIDKAIIINNAVKFAKKFGDGGEKDYKYVNAILQSCLKDGTRELLFGNAN